MSSVFNKVVDILSEARREKVVILLEDGKLKIGVDEKIGINTSLFEDIKKHKAAITDFLSGSQVLEKGQQEQIERVDRSGGEPLPLSYGQEGLWIIDQLVGSVQYHIPLCLRLKGPLDVAVLESALRAVVNRHEVLRTVIRQDDVGKPGQYILESDRWVLVKVAGGQHLHDSNALKTYMSGLSSQPFDLSADHMMKGYLVQISEQEHVLALVLHHIAAEGWSVSLLLKELMAFYDAISEKRPVKLPDLPLQYADYAVWQRRQLGEGKFNNALSYWAQKLQGVAQLEMPTDFVRPAVLSTKGAALTFHLDALLVNKLKTLARQQDATLYMLLLSVFKVLLYRYTGEEDICVGTATAGRTRQELEPLIGYFVNTLALRSNLADNPVFTVLLQQLVQTTRDAYEYQDVPFERVVEASGQQLEAGRNPLYQVIFTMQNMPALPELHLGNAVLEMVELDHNTSQFDLNVSVAEADGGLVILTEYCTDLFRPDTVQRIFGHYQQLLLAVVEQPFARIGDLPMLYAQELEQLLSMAAAPLLNYPAEKTIVGLFREQALQTPAETALIFEGLKLSYQELEQRSNQLSHYLAEQGVKEEMLVPLCMERGLEMIVSILAILKAGGAYVPVDPSYPAERMSYMLEDTNATILISNAASVGVLPSFPGIKVLLSDDIQIATYSSLPLERRLMADNLAYVMYTSGSTGQPKGVLVTHRNVSSLAKGSGFISLSASDVLLSTGAPSFDATTIEYWGMLLNGGTLVLSSEESLLDAGLLKAAIRRYGVTVMWFTSSWFNQLVDLDLDVFEGLSSVMVGGEKLSSRHVNIFRDRYKETTIINGYGPTENTTFSLTYRLNGNDYGDNIPIGRPLGNRTAYILDGAMNVLPIGVAGELYVSGSGLSRGYLNRADLTSTRFLPNPFSPGALMYKTGDKARMLSDGNVEFLGRMDDQVKIRGYRIEPGEIEQVILQSQLVSNAVVIVRTKENGSKLLAAYVVPGGDYQQEILQHYLLAKLPEYMIPAVIMELDVLPLTRNGKVDKKGLPDPAFGEDAVTARVLPRTDMEKTIAAIWETALGLEGIGVNEDFFQLGGDSIIAIGVISQLRHAFTEHIRLYDLYESATIAKLTVLIEQYMMATHSAGNVKAEVTRELDALRVRVMPYLPANADISDVFPMSDIQGGMIYAALLYPEQAAYHDQMTYPLPFALDRKVFEQAATLLTERHGMMRTLFFPELEDGLQVVYNKIPVHIDYRDVSDLPKEAAKVYVKKYLQQERGKPFDVRRELWRMTLLRCCDSHLFIFQFHHTLLDGWSEAIFRTELNELYLSLLEGKAPVLPPLSATYRDFVIEQLIEKRNGAYKTFWQTEMEGFKRLDIFSTFNTENDHPVKIYPTAYLDKLKGRAEADGISLKGVLLGAYLYTLSLLTNEDEVTLGLVSNGRPIVESGDKILGCFLNTVPLRLLLEKNITWKQFFNQVEAKLLQLKEYDRLPLFDIARGAGEQPENGNPFFDAIFNYVNFHVGGQSDRGLFEEENMEAGTYIIPEGNDNTNTYLDCSVSITGNRLLVKMQLLKQLKSNKTAGDLQRYFDGVLEAYLHRYNEEVDIKVVLPEQELQLLNTFSGLAIPAAPAQTIVDMFREQVLKNPEATALVFEDELLTYGQLEQRTNQLAHYLRGLGVREETMVPVCMERSTSMIISLLGIIKAGGAYVPIDPAHPQERMKYILEDTNAFLAISSAACAPLLPDLPGVQVVVLETDTGIEKEHAEDAPVTDLLPGHLAYVIYTSGSTGQPKGVLIEHGMVVNMTAAVGSIYGISSQDRIVMFANYCFDSSAEQLFLALLKGAVLVLFPEGLQLDPQRFQAFLAEKEVTHLDTTPGFLETIAPAAYKGLRNVSSGGEAGQVKMAVQWAPYVNFYNSYGPTECTVTTIIYGFKPGVLEDSNLLPVGKPVAHTSARILDTKGNLLPLGVAGELYLGGSQVGRGYLNRSALTAERFLTDPFSSIKDARMYKTGDMARWLPDGNIELLGRMDEQVKIRGYRIEPGEIAHVMQQSPMVGQAVVLVTETPAVVRQLVAYITPGEGLDLVALRVWLLLRLPEYMVPVVIIPLETLPLNRNGKVDKRKLPAPDVPVLLNTTYVPPRNELEQQLANTWEALLGTAPIGIHDDFFVLGGHSLLAMRMLSRIRQLGYNVQMKTLLSNKTIASLSAELVNAFNHLVEEHLVLLSSNDGKPPVFLIPGSTGASEEYDELAKAMEHLYTVYGMQMVGLLLHERPLTTISDIAATNIQWMRKVQPAGPYSLLAHSFGALVGYEMVRQLEQCGDEVSQFIILDAAADMGQRTHSLVTDIPHFTSGFLEKYGLIQPSGPGWLQELHTVIADLPWQDVAAAVVSFVKSMLVINEEQAVILQSLELQLTNALMEYLVAGVIRAPLTLVKAADEDWSDYGYDLGWKAHTVSVTVLTADGNHFSMIKEGQAKQLIEQVF